MGIRAASGRRRTAFRRTPFRHSRRRPTTIYWIGTSGGLVRFDGTEFVLYDCDNTPIRENSVFCLTVGRDGTLWAGTDGGGSLRYRGGVFRSYTAADGIANMFVRAVIESRTGILWVGSLGGRFEFAAR